MAFTLATSEDEARKTFSHAEELIFRDGKVWVPIEVTEREGSFLTAWQEGAKEWLKARKQAHFHPVRAIENTQQPVDSPGSGSPQGFHPFPSRTRKLSPAAPMVLPLESGRVGRCQAFFCPKSSSFAKPRLLRGCAHPPPALLICRLVCSPLWFSTFFTVQP
jgi:hypothetical protein